MKRPFQGCRSGWKASWASGAAQERPAEVLDCSAAATPDDINLEGDRREDTIRQFQKCKTPRYTDGCVSRLEARLLPSPRNMNERNCMQTAGLALAVRNPSLKMYLDQGGLDTVQIFVPAG